MEAGELRGICIRFLESNPDHPGLLLTRAIAESMCSDAEASATEQGVRNGIQSAFSEKFRMPGSELTDAIDWMFDLAERDPADGEWLGDDREKALAAPLVVALLGFLGTPDLEWAGEAALRRASASPHRSVRRVVSVRRLEQVMRTMERAVERTMARWTSLPVADRRR